MGMPIDLRVGDCLDVLRTLEPESVQLVVTSPPYALQRKDVYGSVHPDGYVEWFLPRSAELWRILKPGGTFILNIKEHVQSGVRHPYVRRLVDGLEAQGWLLTEEFAWHKRNSAPGKWPNRFRDGWERLYQFNKQRQFAMYQSAVMVPQGDWHAGRMGNLSEKDKVRGVSAVGSGFSRNVAKWGGRTHAYPDNVLLLERDVALEVADAVIAAAMAEHPGWLAGALSGVADPGVVHLATECSNRGHGAVFPVALPEWFIKLFTVKGDVVCDPFTGSGTVAVAAAGLGRSFVGSELDPVFVAIAEARVARALSGGGSPVGVPLPVPVGGSALDLFGGDDDLLDVIPSM